MQRPVLCESSQNNSNPTHRIVEPYPIMTAVVTPPGPWAPINRIGGQSGGQPFVACKWVQGTHGLVVRGLDVWWHSDYLRGVQVTYSDDSRSSVFGTAGDSHSSIVFAPGELVTALTLWGNGIGTRTGRIRLTTNKGQTLDVGRDTSGQTAYDIHIGSGILVGLEGRSGSDIDQLGAIFLRSAITHFALTKLVYDHDLAGTDKGIQAVALDEATYSNPSNAKNSMNWAFGGSAERKQSVTYTDTNADTYGVSVDVEVSGEVLGIGAKATTGFQWQRQSTKTTATSTSNQVTLTWSLSGTLEAGESCTCTAIVQRGEGRTNYTADATVTLEDGTKISFPSRGVYQNVSYTKVKVAKVEGQKKNKA